MSELINKINGPPGTASIGRVNYPVTTGRPAVPKGPVTTGGGASFREMLETSLRPQESSQEVTFSKHAMARVAQRGVEITSADLTRLGEAMGKAEEKGITDSLVLMNDRAFIVNVPNRVVVTVVDGGDTQQNIFTNIDGAVIL